MNRIMIAGEKSGSGKTLLTCGLLRCLLKRGLDVQAYKCGPDYIDPMFHKQVIGIDSENLDLFFSDEYYLRHLLDLHADKDISVIEGVMGLFDGLSPASYKGSSYEIAEVTGTPIVFVIDARGMGRTLISVLKGILLDDKKSLIKGVFINNISQGYYKQISPVIEAETGIKVVGYLEKMTDVNIDSRHLGLKLPNEIEDISERLDKLSDTIDSTTDIDVLLEIASCADDITDITKSSAKECLDETGNDKNKPLIAVARDEVFCFLYEDNLRVLREFGAELAFFSPLNDHKLPDGCSGIILPGGYPELRLEELESNTELRLSIKEAIECGTPCMAECGGFMYLHKFIEDEAGLLHEMVGTIDGTCFNTHMLCRFGYVDVDIEPDGRTMRSNIDNDSCPETAWKYTVKGHEFHYYDSDAILEDMKASKPVTGKSWKFGSYRNNSVFGFPHLYYSSCKPLVNNFVSACSKFSRLRLLGEK